jgi:copper chaperone NosL
MLLAIVIEVRMRRKTIRTSVAVSMSTACLLWMTACKPAGPEPVSLNKDNCTDCGMTISDARFASEIVTQKGRVYKFDDLACLIRYKKDNDMKGETVYVSDFDQPDRFLRGDTAFYITGESLSSPMGGNTAAFSSSQRADEAAAKLSCEKTTWQAIAH